MVMISYGYERFLHYYICTNQLNAYQLQINIKPCVLHIECLKITGWLKKEVKDWGATMISGYDVPINTENFQAEKDNIFSYLYFMCLKTRRYYLWIKRTV